VGDGRQVNVNGQRRKGVRHQVGDAVAPLQFARTIRNGWLRTTERCAS